MGREPILNRLTAFWLKVGESNDEWGAITFLPQDFRARSPDLEHCRIYSKRDRFDSTLTPEDRFQFTAKNLIRFSVKGLGSELAGRLTPHQFQPIRLIKGVPALHGPAYLQMRAEVDSRRGVYDTWTTGSNQNLLSLKKPIRLGEVTLEYDPNSGTYSFNRPVFSMRMMFEFMAYVLRDELTREIDPRYFIPWIAVRPSKAWSGISLASGQPDSLPRLRVSSAIQTPEVAVVARTTVTRTDRDDDSFSLPESDAFDLDLAGVVDDEREEVGGVAHEQVADDEIELPDSSSLAFALDSGVAEPDEPVSIRASRPTSRPKNTVALPFIAGLIEDLEGALDRRGKLKPAVEGGLLSLKAVLGVAKHTLTAMGIIPERFSDVDTLGTSPPQVLSSPKATSPVASHSDPQIADLNAREAAIREEAAKVATLQEELRQFVQTNQAEYRKLEELRTETTAAVSDLARTREEVRRELEALFSAKEAEILAKERHLQARNAEVDEQERQIIADLERLEAEQSEINAQREALETAKRHFGLQLLERPELVEGAARAKK